MNPIMNILKRKAINQLQPNEKQSQTLRKQIEQMTNGFKAGTVNPKTTAMDMLKNMSADQKKALKQLVPQLKKLGKTFGVSDKNMNSFITELNNQL